MPTDAAGEPAPESGPTEAAPVPEGGPTPEVAPTEEAPSPDAGPTEELPTPEIGPNGEPTSPSDQAGSPSDQAGPTEGDQAQPTEGDQAGPTDQSEQGKQTEGEQPGKEEKQPPAVCGGGSAFDGVGGGVEGCVGANGEKTVKVEAGIGAGAEGGVEVKELPKEGIGIEGTLSAKRGPVGGELSGGVECDLGGSNCHASVGAQGSVKIGDQGISAKVSIDDTGKVEWKWSFKLGSFEFGNDTGGESSGSSEKTGVQGKVVGHVTKRVP